jgi:transposase
VRNFPIDTQQLLTRLEAALARIATLEAENAELKRRLGLDSGNSSKPPSSDGLKKPPTKSLREKGKRPTGGQPGHAGTTLKQVDQPDSRVDVTANECDSCGADLQAAAPKQRIRRQVFDVTPAKPHVTEYFGDVKECQTCGRRVQPRFPPEIEHAVQYGPEISAWAVNLSVQHMLPLNRVQEILAEILGSSAPSEGTISAMLARAYQRLESVNAEILTHLKAAPVLHLDETGMRVAGELHWMHSASTPALTAYLCHQKRGRPAIEAMGVVQGYSGVAVHDAWAPYWAYDCRHSLCNAHILRELAGWAEQGQAWAQPIVQALLDAHQASVSGLPLDATALTRRYEQAVESAVSATSRPSASNGVVNRLKARQPEILLFLHDPAVPFTNNQAERDIRMVKVKQKIAGCFRTKIGADMFARIRGVLSTYRKQGIGSLKVLGQVFSGSGLVPVQPS